MPTLTMPLYFLPPHSNGPVSLCRNPATIQEARMLIRGQLHDASEGGGEEARTLSTKRSRALIYTGDLGRSAQRKRLRERPLYNLTPSAPNENKQASFAPFFDYHKEAKERKSEINAE